MYVVNDARGASHSPGTLTLLFEDDHDEHRAPKYVALPLELMRLTDVLSVSMSLSALVGRGYAARLFKLKNRPSALDWCHHQWVSLLRKSNGARLFSCLFSGRDREPPEIENRKSLIQVG